ncbi:MAG: hypothetical protein EAX96_06270 [Candidatus Lokiarchaeota archaeon]|nr:hypothetical protein [Candidatus Lokiarchaeota archaeon]
MIKKSEFVEISTNELINILKIIENLSKEIFHIEAIIAVNGLRSTHRLAICNESILDYGNDDELDKISIYEFESFYKNTIWIFNKKWFLNEITQYIDEKIARKVLGLVLFLKKVDEKIKTGIVRAVDYTSMDIANECDRKRDFKSQLGKIARIAYIKTKKDVFEYRRKTVNESLLDINVIKFVSMVNKNVFSEFNKWMDFFYNEIQFIQSPNIYLKKYYKLIYQLAKLENAPIEKLNEINALIQIGVIEGVSPQILKYGDVDEHSTFISMGKNIIGQVFKLQDGMNPSADHSIFVFQSLPNNKIYRLLQQN